MRSFLKNIYPQNWVFKKIKGGFRKRFLSHFIEIRKIYSYYFIFAIIKMYVSLVVFFSIYIWMASETKGKIIIKKSEKYQKLERRIRDSQDSWSTWKLPEYLAQTSKMRHFVQMSHCLYQLWSILASIHYGIMD